MELKSTTISAEIFLTQSYAVVLSSLSIPVTIADKPVQHPIMEIAIGYVAASSAKPL